MTDTMITSVEVRNGHVNLKPRRRRKLLAIKSDPIVTWEETLAEADIGSVNRMLLEKLMTYIVAATMAWDKEVAAFIAPVKKEAPMDEQLRKFFSSNPFGCRNKKMIECLSIALKIPISALTPPSLSDDGDGSDNDYTDLGFLNLAKAGTAIKVTGGRPGERQASLNKAWGDIFFCPPKGGDHRIIRENGSIYHLGLSSLVTRISVMPEHYRSATPLEVLPLLLKLSFAELGTFMNCIMDVEASKELFAKDRSKDETPDDEE